MELVSLLILVLVVVAAFIASKFTHSGNPYPFTQKKSLFTQVETAFLNLLEKAIGSDYKIVSRVRLIDILDFQPGTDDKSRRSALAKAQNKQLDYVLLDKESLKIVAAIDLVNNASKNGHKAKKDWFVNGALESAGIPLIRIKVKSGYKAQEVRQAILFKLGKQVNNSKPIRKSTIKSTPVLSPSQVKSQSTALAQV
ncbi:DUF2726 domain-containing protein [Pseudoalteromonas sp.]|uniref:DUF2726 domain-containing protein n=1 Tax=Pseudoalteromonas sp. TaxID=53249 RepID=UPI0035637105